MSALGGIQVFGLIAHDAKFVRSHGRVRHWLSARLVLARLEVLGDKLFVAVFMAGLDLLLKLDQNLLSGHVVRNLEVADWLHRPKICLE